VDPRESACGDYSAVGDKKADMVADQFGTVLKGHDFSRAAKAKNERGL
jgi:photosystem II stability/assembly factor-like uncharacterized protein